jgi:hypothetical protein
MFPLPQRWHYGDDGSVAIQALVFLVWYGLAVLIFRRKPDDRGALLAVYFLVVLPAVGIYPWLSPSPPLDWILTSAFIFTLLTFGLLFPDGRFAPRWTRWLVVTLVARFLGRLTQMRAVA